jgi:hypothetical protein
LMFARLRAWIEAAAPFPRLGVMRIADALNDRARLDIATVNLPAFLSVVFGSAACEFRHVAQIQNRTLPTAPVPIALDA